MKHLTDATSLQLLFNIMAEHVATNFSLNRILCIPGQHYHDNKKGLKDRGGIIMPRPILRIAEGH